MQGAELARRATVEEMKVRPVVTYQMVDTRLRLKLAQQRATVDEMKVRAWPGMTGEETQGRSGQHTGGAELQSWRSCTPRWARCRCAPSTRYWGVDIRPSWAARRRCRARS